MMQLRQKRVLVDGLLFLFLVVSFICSQAAANTGIAFLWPIHVLTGIIFGILAIVHFKLNMKLFRGIKNQSQGKYIVDCLLVITWVCALLLGFPAMGYRFGELGQLGSLASFHGLLGQIGGALAIIHMVQHGDLIKGYMKKKSIE